MIAFHSTQTKIAAAAFVALFAAAPLADRARAQQVGTAAAVNPAAQARGSGGSRTIIIGQSIAHRERVQTTSAGSVQLLFLDKTSMTIGPNSDLAIDEYVYDPVSNTGKLAATLTKGVMRFVGGQISHAGNAQVTTPNAVVGIRGGVGIFSPQSVYIGYGEGNVRSGSSNVMLSAGEYTQTLGGGAPPTNPGAPPSGFLQSVLAALQSQQGQGGGARATAGQVNQARTNASGSSTGTIATNVQNVVNQTVNTTNQTYALSSINQTIQTTVNQTRVESSGVGAPEHLIGFTGGLSRETQGTQPSDTNILFGAAEFRTDPARNREQANFFFWNGGTGQFGSVDPNQPSSRVTLNGFDDLIGTVTALLPAVDANGKPLSTSGGGVPLAEQQGLLVQFKPGTQITAAAQASLGGTPFCDCEYTRWGFWTANIKHGVPGNIRESIDSFWVAGRRPDAVEVPLHGTATYMGHAVAQIRHGSQEYAASAPFTNVVNFGTGTGTFTVTNLDHATYTGVTAMNPNDRASFVGAGLTNDQGRYMALVGNFYRGSAGPVGEMGGGLLIFSSNPNYYGSGVFLARQK
jgi:hypothetical protein